MTNDDGVQTKRVSHVDCRCAARAAFTASASDGARANTRRAGSNVAASACSGGGFIVLSGISRTYVTLRAIPYKNSSSVS